MKNHHIDSNIKVSPDTFITKVLDNFTDLCYDLHLDPVKILEAYLKLLNAKINANAMGYNLPGKKKEGLQ